MSLSLQILQKADSDLKKQLMTKMLEVVAKNEGKPKRGGKGKGGKGKGKGKGKK